MGDAQRLNTVQTLGSPDAAAVSVADGAATPACAPQAGRHRQSDVLHEHLVAVSSGDIDALADLYDATANRVYGLVHRCLRDPRAAEQVTCDVFSEIWLTATSFDPTRTSALSWVIALTHRRVVDRLRSARSPTECAHAAGLVASTGSAFADNTAVPDTVPDASFDEVPDVAVRVFTSETHAAAEAPCLQRERTGAVHDLLARVSPLHREVMEATYFDGRSHSELPPQGTRWPGEPVHVIHEALVELRDLVASERLIR